MARILARLQDVTLPEPDAVPRLAEFFSRWATSSPPATFATNRIASI